MDFNTTKVVPNIGTLTVLYGEGGTHKTTIIAEAVKNAKKGIFVSVGENGIAKLQESKVYGDIQDIETLDHTVRFWSKMVQNGKKEDGSPKWEDQGFVGLLGWLAKQDYTDIAFDSLTVLGGAISEHCFSKYFVETDKKGKTKAELQLEADGYGGSPMTKAVDKEIQILWKAIRFLREKGINVWITAHTRVMKCKEVGEELEYDTTTIDFPSCKGTEVGKFLYNISDNYFYCYRPTTVFAGKKSNTAVIDDTVKIMTKGTAYLKAKTRLGAPDGIDASYEAIKQYI